MALTFQVTRLRVANRRLSAGLGDKVQIDYSSDHESDMEDPEDLRLTLSPSALSGDMVTLNGDLADNLTSSEETNAIRMHNVQLESTHNDGSLTSDNTKHRFFNGSKTITNGDFNDNSSNCSDRFRKYSNSSSINGDHNHLRDDVVSSPLRKRSTSSECSDGGASNSSTGVCREPISRRTSHTLADAFLEQLPEVQCRDAQEIESA